MPERLNKQEVIALALINGERERHGEVAITWHYFANIMVPARRERAYLDATYIMDALDGSDFVIEPRK